MARRLSTLSRRLEAIEKARETWPSVVLAFKEEWETEEEALEVYYEENPENRPTEGKGHDLVIFLEYGPPDPRDPEQGPASIREDGT